MRLLSKPDKIIRHEKVRLAICCLTFLILGLFLGWKNVPGFLKANFILLTDPKVIGSLFEQNELDTLHLNVSFKNLQKIEAKRNDALSKGKLVSSNEDFVKAVLSNGKVDLGCKIRLKGDLSDHWSGDKWSLRVEMKGDGLVKGMSRFSLQDPETRKGTDEWLFLNSLSKEDCMTVRYEFINLVLNGKDMGIYAMEEHFSKEMIEANQRREGVIVAFDEHLVWRKFPPQLFDNINWDTIFRSSGLVLRNSKRVRTNESLSRQKETAFNLIRNLQEEKLKGSEIFSIDKLGKFLALTHLWNAEHGLGLDDINFFFDPVTSLLEPIGFGAELGTTSHFCFFTSGDMKENWMNFALRDPAIANSYVKYLVKFSSEKYIDSLEANLSEKEMPYRKLLIREFIGREAASIWDNKNRIISYDPWENIRRKAKKIRNELSEKQLIFGYARPLDSNGSLEIILRNTTTQPIEVTGFQQGKEQWDAMESIVEPGKETVTTNPLNGNVIINPRNTQKWSNPFNHRFILKMAPKVQDEVAHLSVQHRFLGNPSPPHLREIPVDKFIFNPEALPFYNDHSSIDELSSFLSEDNRTFLIPEGNHSITKSLFIPMGYKLVIAPGVILSFSKNCTLTSMSPFHAIGTPEKPIEFTSSKESWPGFLLTQAEGESFFENVMFNKIWGVGKKPNSNGLSINGWNMTGGVTIYKSSSKFLNCTFDEIMTEDALNIIGSSFSLQSCKFRNLFSDGFDGDFVQGELRDCTFNKIMGDGVDLSGSKVSVVNCSFYDVEDKAISIGEGSQVHIRAAKVDRVSFGIVSKDMSEVHVKESRVSNAGIVAFSAFQKKNSFGPATITVSESQVVNSSRTFLVQDGSSGQYNGTRISTEPLEVDKLYTEK